jgi:hypothetical protein
MARDAARTPSAVETRARQRATRREQASAAAAKAGGMLSLAVVLLGSPVAIQHHSSHAQGATPSRTAAHAAPRTAAAPDMPR